MSAACMQACVADFEGGLRLRLRLRRCLRGDGFGECALAVGMLDLGSKCESSKAWMRL